MLNIQLIASAALVAAVLLFMWRLPRRGEAFFGWAPPLALLSAWVGLAALIGTIVLWFLESPDTWLATLFLLLDPCAIATGVLVLWIYRGYDEDSETVAFQLTQARVGISLGMLAVIIGYVYVMKHKPPDILPF